MIKNFLIEALFIVTIFSGFVCIAAILGWFWGSEDAKGIFLFSGVLVLLCAMVISFVKDGWKRLLAEIFSSLPW